MRRNIIAILTIAAIIRLISLNQSLWLDEATTARTLQQFSLTQIVAKFSIYDFHPPLYYLFMKLWTNIFGYSEIALRLPSVIFSLLTGWILFLISGIWTASFFLFNPLIIYYSQEARMYSMAVFFITAIIYYLRKITGGKFEKRDILFCNLFIFLSFLTFYGSVFFIAAVYLYLLWKRKFNMLLKLLPGFLFSFVIVSPLLYKQFLNSQIVTQAVINWKQVLGPASIKNLVLIPMKFAFGRISFEPKKIYYAIAGIWTAFVFFVLAINSLFLKNKELKIKDKRTEALLFLFVVPIFLGTVISFYTPLLQYFRFLYLIPVLALLFAGEEKNIVNRFIVIGGFVILSFIYLFNPQFHREDWKSLAASLPKNKSVYMIPSSSDPVLYYEPNLKILDIRSISSIRNFEKEIVTIPYTAEIHGVDYAKLINEAGFHKINKVTFREVFYIRATL